jgi:hypothetical protein
MRVITNNNHNWQLYFIFLFIIIIIIFFFGGTISLKLNWEIISIIWPSFFYFFYFFFNLNFFNNKFWVVNFCYFAELEKNVYFRFQLCFFQQTFCSFSEIEKIAKNWKWNTDLTHLYNIIYNIIIIIIIIIINLIMLMKWKPAGRVKGHPPSTPCRMDDVWIENTFSLVFCVS